MIYKTVDLYYHFGQKRPEGGVGYLKCMCLEPIEQVNAGRRYPAMLVIAGGAYRWVSEREQEPVALGYLSQGYSAFMLRYTCAPHSYPVALREAVMAMLYIRQNAAELHIDPEMVCAMGFSAGGHLLGSLANLYNDGSCDDLIGKTGISPRPDAAVYCYPVITTGEKTHPESAANISGGDAQLAEYLSIEKRITADAPPAFIWHTWEDQSVPVSNSLLLAAAYEKVGVPFALHIFEKGIHGMSTADSQVYRSDDIPVCSTDMPSWLSMSVSWLRDRGIAIRD